jgi:succinyl-CoA synthetase alpha subunit
MIVKNIVRENTYLDSIMLMSISNQMKKLENVEEAAAIMGSEANKELLREIGILTKDGEGAKPGDLIIAIKTNSNAALNNAIRGVDELLMRRADEKSSLQNVKPLSHAAALRMMPAANLTLISLPGQYAGREAMAVLESGRHVMIFSDNVPLTEEIELKKKAKELGLLVMGPDCGTAIINGTALGFANRIKRGPIGIVGASGTGIQEISTLLHKRGYGISHAIGVGGRDLSREVKGLSMLQGIHALETDPETEIVILLSKPPAPVVAEIILDTVVRLNKKYIVNFLYGDPSEAERRKLPFAAGLEEAVDLAVAVYEGKKYSTTTFSQDREIITARAEEEGEKIGKGKFLRGLFSGGTLAHEAIMILSRELGSIYSNSPLNEKLALKNNWKSNQHTVVDLGDDVFTRGRPHPMIDYTLRSERLIQEASDEDCGVILLDVVLGFGSHPDPSSALIPAVEEAQKIARKDGRRLSFVASVTGTDEDPQNYTAQKSALEKAGVTILPSNAQASRYAALLLK